MLTVRDLNVHYGKIHAVRGVSFRVEGGEIVSIVTGRASTPS